MDYGLAPVTDGPTGTLNELIARRVPATTMVNVRTVRDFINGLNLDGSLHPVGDLVICAHANSEGKWFITLFDGQQDNVGELTTRTTFENIEQSMEAGALLRRIKIDNATIGFTTPPPTHSLHMKGCSLGKSLPFLTKMKAALGGNVLVTAPKHFQAVYGVSRTGNNGSFEYMCYEFQVQTPAVLENRKFRGYATRAALLTAFAGGGFSYLSGAVPAADWEKWVPSGITQTQTFYMALPLGATVAGLTALTLRPDRRGRGGAREFRVRRAEEPWGFVAPPGATTDQAKKAALRAKIEEVPRYKSFHEWPAYERIGFPTLDAYMDGHHWSFGPKMATGRRFEYTVVLPITDNSGPDPQLIFNYFPAPGAAQAAITTGILQNDTNYYAKA